MKEELTIQAFELLEEGKAFSILSEEEKNIVLRAFGSKEEYARMLSVSGIATEEDEEIIAPSMMTESALMKEFASAHSNRAEKKEGLKFNWLATFISNRVTRIVLPALVLIAGIFWFVNDSGIEKNQVSYQTTEESKLNEKPSKKDIEFRNYKIDKSITHEDSSNEAVKTESNQQVQISKEELELEEIVSDRETLEEEEEEEINDIRTENTIILSDKNSYEFSTTSPPQNDGVTISAGDAHFKNKDSKSLIDDDVEKDKIAESFQFDDKMGNMASPDIVLEEVTKSKVERTRKKYRSDYVGVSASSSAQEDGDLFDLLFTTY